MNNDKDYNSESDSSDEDFCPDENAGQESSDEDVGDDDVEGEQETENTKKPRGKGNGAKRKGVTTEPIEADTKRSTRHSKTASSTQHSSVEKEEIESDDEEKARADALWADFLGDVKHTTVETNKTESSSKTSKLPSKAYEEKVDVKKSSNSLEETPKEVTITEVLDFAGEEVVVQKTISADSVKENKSDTSKNPSEGTSNQSFMVGVKRSAAPSSSGRGLGSLLNQIGKKKKISVLEKTKMDWNTFKKDEGIEEELQTFNKGKDGFLERQDFLERTDLRQFEIERNLRQTRRKH